LLAFLALKPVGRLVAHDHGDLAPHVELADAVRVVVVAELVARLLVVGERRGSEDRQGRECRQESAHRSPPMSCCSTCHAMYSRRPSPGNPPPCLPWRGARL